MGDWEVLVSGDPGEGAMWLACGCPAVSAQFQNSSPLPWLEGQHMSKSTDPEKEEISPGGVLITDFSY